MAQADRTQPTNGAAARAAGPGRTAPADGAGETRGLDQAFDRSSLAALRSAVAAHGGALGLAGERLDMLVVVAHELASNSVRHGGGSGRLRLWRDRDTVYCRVTDRRTGFPVRDLRAWDQRPPAQAEGGRGLYFAYTLADGMTVDSTDSGTAIIAAFTVS